MSIGDSARIHRLSVLKPSTLKERWEFYACLDTGLLARFFDFRQSVPLMSLDLGSETRISLNSPVETYLYLVRCQNWEGFRWKMLRYLPESVYYDRNEHVHPRRCLTCDPRADRLGLACSSCENVVAHEVVFDIDPENFPCHLCGNPPQRDVRSWCLSCTTAAIHETVRLCCLLEEMGFARIIPVFTGRGCHIHLHDAGALKWSTDQRVEFTHQLQTMGFRIDPWVSNGEMFLARLPYSLHGVVNREVRVLTVRQLKMMSQSTDLLLESAPRPNSERRVRANQMLHLLRLEQAHSS